MDSLFQKKFCIGTIFPAKVIISWAQFSTRLVFWTITSFRGTFPGAVFLEIIFSEECRENFLRHRSQRVYFFRTQSSMGAVFCGGYFLSSYPEWTMFRWAFFCWGFF